MRGESHGKSLRHAACANDADLMRCRHDASL